MFQRVDSLNRFISLFLMIPYVWAFIDKSIYYQAPFIPNTSFSTSNLILMTEFIGTGTNVKEYCFATDQTTNYFIDI